MQRKPFLILGVSAFALALGACGPKTQGESRRTSRGPAELRIQTSLELVDKNGKTLRTLGLTSDASIDAIHWDSYQVYPQNYADEDQTLRLVRDGGPVNVSVSFAGNSYEINDWDSGDDDCWANGALSGSDENGHFITAHVTCQSLSLDVSGADGLGDRVLTSYGSFGVSVAGECNVSLSFSGELNDNKDAGIWNVSSEGCGEDWYGDIDGSIFLSGGTPTIEVPMGDEEETRTVTVYDNGREASGTFRTRLGTSAAIVFNDGDDRVEDDTKFGLCKPEE